MVYMSEEEEEEEGELDYGGEDDEVATRRFDFNDYYDDYGDSHGHHHNRGGGGHDYHDYHDDELFRGHEAPPKVIRNPRDNRFFPGNEPAGIEGISPALFHFITMHVNQVSFFVQGPPPPSEHHEHFP